LWRTWKAPINDLKKEAGWMPSLKKLPNATEERSDDEMNYCLGSKSSTILIDELTQSRWGGWLDNDLRNSALLTLRGWQGEARERSWVGVCGRCENEWRRTKSISTNATSHGAERIPRIVKRVDDWAGWGGLPELKWVASKFKHEPSSPTNLLVKSRADKFK
jgi:hypothetical protein